MVAERIEDEGGGDARRFAELARGHLPLIMPERAVTVGDYLGKDQDIGTLVNGIDPHALHRTTLRDRNRRRHAGEKVDSVPDALPDGPVLKRTSKHPGSRSTVRKDPMLERAVPLEPVMVHLIRLCRDRDARRGEFVACYCVVLSRSPRGVSREVLAEMAAAEPFIMHVATAYRWLDWAYRVFSEWALGEYLDGHVFTAEELAPMRSLVQTQAEGWPLDGADEQPGEQC